MVETEQPPPTPYTLTKDRRGYACARCGDELPDGAAVVGTVDRGELIGVSAWKEGTLDDGTQGMTVVHACGDAPDWPADVAGHHDQLRGAAPPNSGVSEV